VAGLLAGAVVGEVVGVLVAGLVVGVVVGVPPPDLALTSMATAELAGIVTLAVPPETVTEAPAQPELVAPPAITS
jgi:LytS/YehU family sensor histidine kinase